MSRNKYDIGLDRNAANFVPLSPLSFIERAANVYPARTAMAVSRKWWKFEDGVISG